MGDVLDISPAGRRYGCYRDRIDPALKARLMLRLAAAPKLPPAVSLAPWMGPIRNQGNEGSCTGQAGAALRDLIYRKRFLFESSQSVPAAQFQASAGFVYKSNLIADGNLGTDCGSTMHQTAVTLHAKGACLEAQEPYSDQDYSTPPTDQQYQEAEVYRLGATLSLPTLLEIKACLASGYSGIFGIDVYASFEGAEIANSGMMPMPMRAEQFLGGHAQHWLGYDDTIRFAHGLTGGLFIQNSWGSQWGISAAGRTDRGCYWMPYQYVLDGHVNDIWTLRQAQPAMEALLRAA